LGDEIFLSKEKRIELLGQSRGRLLQGSVNGFSDIFLNPRREHTQKNLVKDAVFSLLNRDVEGIELNVNGGFTKERGFFIQTPSNHPAWELDTSVQYSVVDQSRVLVVEVDVLEVEVEISDPNFGGNFILESNQEVEDYILDLGFLNMENKVVNEELGALRFTFNRRQFDVLREVLQKRSRDLAQLRKGVQW